MSDFATRDVVRHWAGQVTRPEAGIRSVLEALADFAVLEADALCVRVSLADLAARVGHSMAQTWFMLMQMHQGGFVRDLRLFGTGMITLSLPVPDVTAQGDDHGRAAA